VENNFIKNVINVVFEKGSLGKKGDKKFFGLILFIIGGIIFAIGSWLNSAPVALVGIFVIVGGLAIAFS
jgi:hypothetical protein